MQNRRKASLSLLEQDDVGTNSANKPSKDLSVDFNTDYRQLEDTSIKPAFGIDKIDSLQIPMLREILGQKQKAREELYSILQKRDAIVAELEKYEKEIPSIMRIKELEMELDEVKKLNKNYETHITRLEKELRIVGLEAMRLESDRIEADAQCKSYRWQLSRILDDMDKLEKKNVALRQCLQIFLILIIPPAMELSLITRYKRSQWYLS